MLKDNSDITICLTSAGRWKLLEKTISSLVSYWDGTPPADFFIHEDRGDIPAAIHQDLERFIYRHWKLTPKVLFSYQAGQTYCAVNDTYPLVLFLVRESASVEATPAGGRAGSLLRTVNFKLVANSKFENGEFAIASIINRTKGITYVGTDFNSKAIANQYFGLPERNFETYFFAIDFTVTERINCEVTC